jgi:hypothetical protein
VLPIVLAVAGAILVIVVERFGTGVAPADSEPNA